MSAPEAGGGVIAVYVVTYKRPEVLERAVASLWRGAHEPERVRLTIINNHTEFELPTSSHDVRVLHNVVRPDRAWGNLARDWNAGLLDAFGTSAGSDVTWCVLAQNDVEWLPDWQRRLDALPDGLDFFSQPRGDQSMGFRISAVRDVGFFDERFSTIAFQEQDYFTRAAALLGDRASINDDHMGSAGCWNPRQPIINEPSFHGYSAEDPLLHTTAFERELSNLLTHKWQVSDFHDIFDRQKMVDRLRAGTIVLPDELDWYPYFWNGLGNPHRDGVYDQPYQGPARTYVVVQDGKDRLIEALVAVSQHADGQSCEVLVDCGDDAVVQLVSREVRGNVVFTPSAPGTTDEDRRGRLIRMARGREVLTVS
ncbi:glycosyltransferase family 2 protein [Kineococcus sp. SYSU DK006]|uniref:glycosyltransferase family 2 protein n=1 Tax=Kineococcus sp. SYSU DK006 TaxID=3383127 RepID=UPI003D7C5500